ncbi:uncharacterized protein LOC126733979 [Anthonomus grandis grandis]|uniref:uncharacterized protein LOC126733979 n=1 Tax=Anthonomus grandis grandis TaxID=2921223 RepID=UPI00216671D4|nr:uncharacterized protein LOC126733979 [Anthonomus grandis grandis]
MEPSTWIKDTGRPSAGHPFSSLNPNASEFIPRFNAAPSTSPSPLLHTAIPSVRACLPPGYAIVSPICPVSSGQRPPFGCQPFTLPLQVPHADTSYKAPDHLSEEKPELEEPIQAQKVEEKPKTDSYPIRNNYGFNRRDISRGYKHSLESSRPRTDSENFRRNLNQGPWNENGEERQEEPLRNHDRNYRERGSIRLEPNQQNNVASGGAIATEKKKDAYEEQQRNYRSGFNNRGRSGYRLNTDRREVQRHQSDFNRKFEKGNEDWRDNQEEKFHELYRSQNSNYRGGFYRGRGQRWNKSREQISSHDIDKECEVVKSKVMTEGVEENKIWSKDGHETYSKPLKSYEGYYRGKGRGGHRSNRGRKSPIHQNNFNDEKLEDAKQKLNLAENNAGEENSEAHHQDNLESKEHYCKGEWESSWADHNSEEKILEEPNTSYHQISIDVKHQNEVKENEFGSVGQGDDKEKTIITSEIIRKNGEDEKDLTEPDSIQKPLVKECSNQNQIIRDKSPSKSTAARGTEKPVVQRQNRAKERNGSEQNAKNSSRRGRLSNADFSKNYDSKPRGRGTGGRGRLSDRQPLKSNEVKETCSEEHLVLNESNQISETPLEKDKMNRSWIQEMEEERNLQEQTQEAPQTLPWRTRNNGGSTFKDRYWDKERKMRRSLEKQNGDTGSWRHRSDTVQEDCKYRDPRMEREKKQFYLKPTGFEQWERQWMMMQIEKDIEEIEGNLFNQPKEFSLVHCVAEDFRMGSGIAVTFKREFGNQAELLDQYVKPGGLAVLFDEEHQRFIYYLVTKKESSGKPTYQDLWESLCKLKDHIKENKVTKLAMPRLGCGLDRLEWNKVKAMLAHLFDNVDVEIRVCNLVQSEPAEEKKSNTCKLVVEDNTALTNIDSGTLLLYFTDTEGTSDDTMLRLSKKFNFMEEFNQHTPKSLGDIVYFDDNVTNYGICGCIVRKSPNDTISFKALQKCIENINEKNKAFGDSAFLYVAMQWVNEEAYLDKTVNQKIISVLINILKDASVHVCKGNFGDEGE